MQLFMRYVNNRKKGDSRMYSKKVLYTVLIIEAILLIASSFLKPLIDSSLKEVILLAFILLPILSLLLIIGLDASINSRKRIIAVVVFLFLIVVAFLATIAEFMPVVTLR